MVMLRAAAPAGAEHASSSTASANQEHIFAGDGNARIAGDVGHQAQAIGVVSMDAAIAVNDQGVGRTSQCYARALRVRGLRGFQLEGDGHIAALAAFGNELLQIFGKALQRHQAAAVVQCLLCQLRKACVDPGERLWATGLPMTQYMSSVVCMAKRASGVNAHWFQGLVAGELKA